MLLVQPRKDDPKRWEVAWMWIPTFMSMNSELVKFVDQKMTEKFKGRPLDDPELPGEMHLAVIETLCEKFPMKGLDYFLSSIFAVDPGKHDA
jgi:hypothetical protein